MKNIICKKLKDLRERRGYSLDEISQMIPVSKQGYHMWEQGTRGWKLDVLTTLSKILGFKIVIEDGKLEISEHIKESNDINTENNKSEVNNMISKTELEKFEIVKLYTGAENINFDEIIKKEAIKNI